MSTMIPPGRRPRSSPTAATKAGPGSAVRRGDVKISGPVTSTFTHTRPSPEQEQAFDRQGVVTASDGAWPRKSMPTPYTSGDHIPPVPHDEEHRMSLGPSVILSSMSSAPSKSSLVQRKPAGLKATIKRMFGSKRQRTSISEQRRDFYRSEPSDLKAAARSRGMSRGHSQPERPVTKSSALGSHDPSDAVDTGVPRSPSPATPNLIHKRRNTLPSLQFSELEIQDFSKLLDDHMGRSHLGRRPKDDEVIIYNEKRRSRSADALTRSDATQDPNGCERQDRSSEIAYWRNSIVMNPLPALTKPTLERTSFNASPTRRKRHVISPLQPIKPAQNFDFGLSVGDGPVDLEERVNTIEVKMFDFEYAIARLQGIELPRPSLPPKAVRRNVTHEKSSESILPSTSVESLERGMTFLSSPEQSPSLSGEFDKHTAPDRSSKATIRPSTSQRAMNQSRAESTMSVRMSHDEFEILMALINDEKAARQQMEMQLMQLQKEVEQLQAPVYAAIRPVPHSAHSPNSVVRSQVSPKAKTLHRTPAFDFAKTTNHDVSRFSVSDSEADSEGFQDSFETPQENRFHFETTRGSPLVSVSY